MGLIILKYFSFWYGKGLIMLFQYFKAYVLILADTFSVKTSITTLFYPWKRDSLNLRGLPLDEKFKALIFNIISRFFGAFIKIFSLLIFLIVFLILIILELAVFVIWVIAPFLPIIAILFFILFLQEYATA